MARFGEQLQKLIEPIIRDFIECMEPGTPRVEIESRHKEKNCLVLMSFKKKPIWTKFVQGWIQYQIWTRRKIFATFFEWRVQSMEIFSSFSRGSFYRFIFRQFCFTIYFGLSFSDNQNTTLFRKYIYKVFTISTHFSIFLLSICKKLKKNIILCSIFVYIDPIFYAGFLRIPTIRMWRCKFQTK